MQKGNQEIKQEATYKRIITCNMVQCVRQMCDASKVDLSPCHILSQALRTSSEQYFMTTRTSDRKKAAQRKEMVRPPPCRMFYAMTNSGYISI